jgi:hypothetical protein
MAVATALILFLIAAVFGLINLSAVLRNKRTKGLMVLAHGSFAVTALLVLISFIVAGHANPLLITSVSLFILAALGGFTLLTFDLSKKPIPKALALLHPAIALSAIVVLVVFLLQQG